MSHRTDPNVMPPPSPRLVNAANAARHLGVSRAHFYRMHNAARVPMPVRLGGAVRWRVKELDAWIDAGMPPRQRWHAPHAAPGREGGAR